ncbi:hypothetical protein PLICRDRAFT_216615 [Plicaturopsis crispa FD-325 SS-3]|nr:hypothetical protein PLICRDRAFT_216615 [Plicaturopsis crispa FD-325 SS-3]
MRVFETLCTSGNTLVFNYAQAAEVYKRSPSIFLKSPQEHIRESWTDGGGECPPGWIRIHFHAKFADYMNMKAEDLSFIAPLDRKTGELDLAFVYEGLGLESYAIIDPVRFTVFEPRRRDRVSAVALKVLTETQAHITIFEPYASPLTQRKREIRLYFLGMCDEGNRAHDPTLECAFGGTLRRACHAISHLDDANASELSVTHFLQAFSSLLLYVCKLFWALTQPSRAILHAYCTSGRIEGEDLREIHDGVDVFFWTVFVGICWWYDC